MNRIIASFLFFLFCLTNSSSFATQNIDTVVAIESIDSLSIDDSLYNPSSTFMNKPKIKSELKAIGFIDYVDAGLHNEDRFVKFSYRLIIILFVIFIATFLFIISNRLLVEYFKRKKLKINDRIEELIAIYISLENDSKIESDEICNELKFMQKNPTAKRIILKNILSVDHAFSGESNNQLRLLYTSLNYHKSALQKLKSEFLTKIISTLIFYSKIQKTTI